jgi:hypothetical protein
MTLYTKNGSYPQSIPFRIRLSDGSTRTDPSTFTEEEIADAGYTQVSNRPTPNSVQVVEWDSLNINWILRDKTLEELQAETQSVWKSIRAERDRRIHDIMWRYERWSRHERLGIQQIDSISALDNYVQALANIPQTQEDPYDIVWPVLSE